jgi:hypothetical protein
VKSEVKKKELLLWEVVFLIRVSGYPYWVFLIRVSGYPYWVFLIRVSGYPYWVFLIRVSGIPSMDIPLTLIRNIAYLASLGSGYPSGYPTDPY